MAEKTENTFRKKSNVGQPYVKSVTVSPALHERISKAAQEKETYNSEIVRVAVEKYLSENGF